MFQRLLLEVYFLEVFEFTKFELEWTLVLLDSIGVLGP